MLSSFAERHEARDQYRWDAEKALQLIESESGHDVRRVPTQSWDFDRVAQLPQYDNLVACIDRWRGRPAPPDPCRPVDEQFGGGRPAIGYGMTETNAYGRELGATTTSRTIQRRSGVPIMGDRGA